MIFFAKIFELLLKIIILMCIISFERVVGYPVLFLTVSITFMLTARTISKYILFFISAWMLAIVYQQLISISLVLFLIFYLGFKYAIIVESNLQRFLGFLLLSLLVLTYSAGLHFTVWILLYLLMSLGISILFLVKVLFANYGFLGNKLTARYSFLK